MSALVRGFNSGIYCGLCGESGSNILLLSHMGGRCGVHCGEHVLGGRMGTEKHLCSHLPGLN